MGNHHLHKLLLKFLTVMSKKTWYSMPIFVTCCIICSPYKIWHLSQWKKSLLCNNPQKVLQKVLMKMHFGLWNCLKMLINLVMKVVSILANFYSLCICITWSVLMVGPTNHLPCYCNFCLIFFLQMLSCQKIVIRLRRLLRIWAWAIRRFMIVLKIVFYIGRRMPTLKLVQTVTVQDGKVMSLKVNKILMLPPRKERRKLQRSYSGSR